MRPKYFHMNESYKIVEVSEEVFYNPPTDWPNNTIVINSDGFLDIRCQNICWFSLVEAIKLLEAVPAKR